MADYRVSTERRGESGLGLEAQREAVARFLGSSFLLAAFTEVMQLHATEPIMPEAAPMPVTPPSTNTSVPVM